MRIFPRIPTIFTSFCLARAGRWVVLAGALVSAGQAAAQSAWEVQATPLRNPARVKLMWPAQPQANQYKIFLTSGRTVLLPGTATTFTDSAVVAGSYSCTISKYATSQPTATINVNIGVELPAVENRGALVLVVDSTHARYLASDLAQLMRDLAGDGWRVIRHDVAPTLPPPQVRALIQADYRSEQQPQVEAVLLLGHVAVPYSGALNPDGHAEHYGAWPADVYYADVDGTWTDRDVNTTQASRAANRNVPGDGKFDPTRIANTVKLQLGRVDLSNLPAFGLPERDLLRRYLRKDHDYRHRVFAATQRGLVDDNFGPLAGPPAENFASSGWKNFRQLFGADSVRAGSYFGRLRTQDYSWAYACGPGTYTAAGGVGSTTDFATGPVLSVFNMLFGSYFGDWDTQDNFLRAPLAAEGHALTSCWVGRPGWTVTELGLGQTIGAATRNTQNSGPSSVWAGLVHIALMGDPTLRQHVVSPPASLTAVASPGRATLSWPASPDADDGYLVYRGATPAGPFTRLTPQPLTSPGFIDLDPPYGTSYYLVRARQLTLSPLGSYYNLSQAVFTDFVAALPPAVTATWLGTSSSDWHLPANWSTGAALARDDSARVVAGTPFAPVVTGHPQVGGLTLAAGAQLTVAAGSSLTVSGTPRLLGAATGQPATQLTLAPAKFPTPGGRLWLPDYASAQSGLQLPAGTVLALGDSAEVRVRGHVTGTGGTFAASSTGRLTFVTDSSLVGITSLTHRVASPVPLTVGGLAVTHPADRLVLNGPVQVLSAVRNAATIVTNGQLTLRSSPGRQAILAYTVSGPYRDRTLGTYSGKIRVEVYVDGSRNAGPGYRHLSAPVSGATVASFATDSFAPTVNSLYNTQGNVARPFPTVFSYNQARLGAAGTPGPAGFDQGWQSPAALSAALTLGAGYTVNMLASQTITYVGTANTSGAYTRTSLPRSYEPEAGWHLLGNPYAAPLDWEVASSGLFRCDPALYVYKSDGPYVGTYASYVPARDTLPGLAVNGGTNVLPVGQGFFVRASQPGYSGASWRVTAQMLLDLPTAGSVQRRRPDQRPQLRLTLRNPAATRAHQTLLYFQPGATTGFDGDFDAVYVAGAGQGLTLASGSAPDLLSINGLPALTGADVTVPLQLQATTAGSYVLAVDTLANLPAGYHPYLRDAVAGTYTDLLATPTVAVALAANASVGNRYSVLFTRQRPDVLATAPAALTELVTLAPNPAHNQATLTVPRALRSQATTTVLLLNSLGQELARHQFSPTAPETLPLPLTGLAAGLYIVQVSTPAGPVSRRLVVE